jgi:hypothetical protein
MSWLLRNGEVLASVELAGWRPSGWKGTADKASIEGAVLVRPALPIHALFRRDPLDVAFCDAQLVVVATASLRHPRVGLPPLRARSAILAEAGAFERWKLAPGDQLEISG